VVEAYAALAGAVPPFLVPPEWPVASEPRSVAGLLAGHGSVDEMQVAGIGVALSVPGVTPGPDRALPRVGVPPVRFFEAPAPPRHTSAVFTHRVRRCLHRDGDAFQVDQSASPTGIMLPAKHRQERSSGASSKARRGAPLAAEAVATAERVDRVLAFRSRVA
jgi:hypothetical protein